VVLVLVIQTCWRTWLARCNDPRLYKGIIDGIAGKVKNLDVSLCRARWRFDQPAGHQLFRWTKGETVAWWANLAREHPLAAFFHSHLIAQPGYIAGGQILLIAKNRRPLE